MQVTRASLLSPDRLRLVIPLAIFSIALGIRLIGIGWGLKNDLHNQSYHPDEGDIFTYSQMIEPAHLKFTPGFYNYGTLYLTLLNVASDMTASYTGGFDPKNADSYWSYVARCESAGRFISAIAGAGTVVVVFVILRRFSSLIGALAGCAALALAPAHVVHSRFQTVDVTALFFLALSLLYTAKLIPLDGEESASDKNALKWIILAGVFAGLSGGVKYTGILGVLSLLVVLYMVRRPRFTKEAAIAVVSTALAFLVTTPGVVLDNERFMRDFTYELQHTATGHGLVFEGTANGFVYQLLNLFQGFGTIATVLGFGGLCYAAYRKQVWAIAVLAFFLPYYVLIGRAGAKFMRYTFPAYLGLSVGFGYAVAKGHEKKGWGKAVVAGGILAVGGVDASGLIGTIKFTGYMVAEDPRDAAARYLKSQSTSSPSVVVGLPEDPWFWSPPLFKDSTMTRMSRKSNRDKAMSEAIDPRVVYYANPDGSPSPFDKRLLTDLKPEFVTYSSLEYVDPERLQGRNDVSDVARTIARQYDEFLSEVQKTYVPDRNFGDDVNEVQDMEYVQPRVVIWKRKPTP